MPIVTINMLEGRGREIKREGPIRCQEIGNLTGNYSYVFKSFFQGLIGYAQHLYPFLIHVVSSGRKLHTEYAFRRKMFLNEGEKLQGEKPVPAQREGIRSR